MKKKSGKISPPALASEEQPAQSRGKQELGEQDPDFTIQPGDEVVELVSDGTQDEGTRSHALYSLSLDVVEEFNNDAFPPFKVPAVAPFLPLERIQLMLAWKAAFEEELNSNYESMDRSSSTTGDKKYAEIMVVLANQDNYLNKCKAMIRGAKCNMELLREASAAKARHFYWVKQFVIINNLLVYRDFKSLEETQVVSCPCRMFDDI
jgi:hypothetical protein